VGERSSEYSLHHTLWNPKSPAASFETSITVLPRESLFPGHTDWAVIQCGPPFATCGWRNIAGTTPEASLYVVLTARLFSGTGFRLTSMSGSGQKIIFAIRALSLPGRRKLQPWLNCQLRSLTNSTSPSCLYLLTLKLASGVAEIRHIRFCQWCSRKCRYGRLHLYSAPRPTV
jgi:hypothetical protein